MLPKILDCFKIIIFFLQVGVQQWLPDEMHDPLSYDRRTLKENIIQNHTVSIMWQLWGCSFLLPGPHIWANKWIE